MAKNNMLKIAFIIGIKLFVIGLLVAVPFLLLRSLFAGMPIVTLLVLIAEITAFGWLVYKWRKWVFE